MADLMSEVERFRAWADATCPPERRFGEWECDYKDWDNLYEAVLEFVATRKFGSWSPEQARAVRKPLTDSMRAGSSAPAHSCS